MDEWETLSPHGVPPYIQQVDQSINYLLAHWLQGARHQKPEGSCTRSISDSDSLGSIQSNNCWDQARFASSFSSKKAEKMSEEKKKEQKNRWVREENPPAYKGRRQKNEEDIRTLENLFQDPHQEKKESLFLQELCQWTKKLESLVVIRKDKHFSYL